MLLSRIYIVLFAFHYLLGKLFLPDGNFFYLSQLPDIYRQYEVVNGKTVFFHFLEENFFEFEDKFDITDDDSPFEKEDRPIPFHPISITINPAVPIVIDDITIEPYTVILKEYSFYLLKKYTTEIFPIFHPPKYYSSQL